jgi:hypothetical protein
MCVSVYVCICVCVYVATFVCVHVNIYILAAIHVILRNKKKRAKWMRTHSTESAQADASHLFVLIYNPKRPKRDLVYNRKRPTRKADASHLFVCYMHVANLLLTCC